MIAGCLRQVARGRPDAPALIDAGGSVSYTELLAAIARVRSLLQKRQIKPGDFVWVPLPSGLEAVASFFACADLGAVFLAANPGWHPAELAWLMKHAPPAVAIVPCGNAGRWGETGLASERMIFPDRDSWFSGADDEDFDPEDCPSDQAVACVVTSGSTGRPKIAMRTQAGMAACARSVGEACGIRPGQSLMATVPVHHSSGLANNLLMPLLNGVTVLFPEHFEPWAAAALIERHGVDCLFSSPIFYTLLLDANVPASMLGSLRVCMCSGAPLASSVREEWRARYQTVVRQAYGTSETGIISVQSEDSPIPGCVGRPIRDTEVRILAEDREQATGEPGEVAVRGPGVVKRFLGDTEALGVRFWKGYLRTGDRGWTDGEGRLYLTGRLRPWINSGGVKVDPAEVQSALSRMSGVRECLVEAEQGPGGMDVVAAVIVPERGLKLTRAEVIQHCRTSLAEFKIPRVIRFAPSLATDLTGKTVKNKKTCSLLGVPGSLATDLTGKTVKPWS